MGEITRDMLDAGKEALHGNARLADGDSAEQIVTAVYKAMDAGRSHVEDEAQRAVSVYTIDSDILISICGEVVARWSEASQQGQALRRFEALLKAAGMDHEPPEAGAAVLD